ncbi:signal peptidase I [Aestuariispira insulae]|uniref:Signal peptidase I n=1 Tax=Aestuariispira insulae TaxID=1461337 RepID=A0A3D9HN14_9PROT|nr:signal peptidase I [Aestuariispira insulae]RED50890.1 signal peptidase I [Aestuariispira insulae]
MAEKLKTENSKSTDKVERKEESWLETVKTLGWAVGIALVVRTFFFEPFNIPSGSMIPTLLVGDYMFVNKMSYGYSKYSLPKAFIPFEGRIFSDIPERGDVAVFRKPSDTSIDYVKRIIGLPGDEIEVRSGVLHINGAPVSRRKVDIDSLDMDKRLDLNFPGSNANGGDKDFQMYVETLPNGREHYILESGGDDMRNDNTGVYTVPEGHYFAMGDNRDNSLDSRYPTVGFVPHENLIGKATFFFFSIDDDAHWYLPWTWPGAIRYGRLLNSID